MTVVVPTGKLTPLGGVQAVVNGAVPPVTDGLPKDTVTEPPSGDVTGSATGQEMSGGVLVSGATEFPEQPEIVHTSRDVKHAERKP